MRKINPMQILNITQSGRNYKGLIETCKILSAPNFRRKFQKARKEIRNKKTVSFETVFGRKWLLLK